MHLYKNFIRLSLLPAISPIFLCKNLKKLFNFVLIIENLMLLL